MAERKKRIIPDMEDVEMEFNTKPETQFVTLEVYGSNGTVYQIEVPSSYQNHIPKKWEWTTERYLVAQLLAEGMDIAKIVEHPDVSVKSRKTIHAWRYHPEFAQYVTELTKEIGLANKQIRIAKYNRLASAMFNKIMNAINEIEINEKNAVAFINAFRELTKQIAQEKEEFVEVAKVEQETEVKVSGSVATTSLSVEEYLKQLPKDEREKLEKEFDKIADHYIQQLRGDYMEDSEGDTTEQ